MGINIGTNFCDTLPFSENFGGVCFSKYLTSELRWDSLNIPKKHENWVSPFKIK